MNLDRKGALGVKGQKSENDFKRSKELRPAPAPGGNAELTRSMQVYARLILSTMHILPYGLILTLNFLRSQNYRDLP